MVALVAPDDLELPVERRPFAESDLDGCWLVLTCTGAIDEVVAAACESRRIWCGRSDDSSESPVWVPAIGRTDTALISVTSGRDPHASVALRDAIVAGLEAGSLP